MNETGETTPAPLLVRVKLVWVDNPDDGPLTIDLAIGTRAPTSCSVR